MNTKDSVNIILIKLAASTVFVGLFIAVLINLNYTSELKNKSEIRLFCGTPSQFSSDSLLNSRQKAGKKLFLTNCASCHNKNMMKDLTGPALGNTFSKWNNDTLGFIQYVRNPELYINTSKNQRLKNLHKEFGQIEAPNNDLTKNQILNILAFIER